MPAPTRRAARRTPSAIAEDLAIARWAGGLSRASHDDLSATLDWLSVTGIYDGHEPLVRARDFLLHYVRRVCDHYDDEAHDRTGVAAARSLEQLLLRPTSDTRLAQVIRRDVTLDIGHAVTTDAVRHREDRLIREMGEQAAQDLAVRRVDVPQTVEDAFHRLAPIVVDLRQDLHDLMCVIYPDVPPRDPRDRRVVQTYFEVTGVGLGELLLAAVNLEQIGYTQPNLTRSEFALVNLGRRMVGYLFEEADDRDWILEFTRERTGTSVFERAEQLRASERGAQLQERWVAWAKSCYPTCAFERTTDMNYMCSPHAFLTLLYDFEAAYIALGYTEPIIEGNQPPRHFGQSRLVDLSDNRIEDQHD